MWTILGLNQCVLLARHLASLLLGVRKYVPCGDDFVDSVGDEGRCFKGAGSAWAARCGNYAARSGGFSDALSFAFFAAFFFALRAAFDIRRASSSSRSSVAC